MKTFTIIGGGATGTLLAANLIKNSENQLITVNLVEKNSRLGRGIAYSTNSDVHLLNVPANKMGAFPDDIEGFYKWLTTNNYDYFSNDFVPRRIYGEYLQHLLSETVKTASENVVVNFYNDEAIDVSSNESQAEIKLKSGKIIISDKVILAFGNFLPPHPKIDNQDYTSAANYFRNPWSEETSEQIHSNDDILIVGTGLTMVDLVLTLSNQNYQGKITAISTHGWLPAVHKLGFVYPSFADELKGKTSIYELFKIVRKHCENAETQKSNWRGVIDSLRPSTQEIWQNLPDKEKRRFMRHLRRIWDISRHRMPGKCSDVLREMQNSGRLQIIQGRIKKIDFQPPDGFEVFYKTKDLLKTIKVDSVVNCSGSESDFRKINIPLVNNLIAKDYIQTDNLSLGIKACSSGKISDVFYTIGTSLKGILWESTAMPEIRVQANQLANRLLINTMD